ncbi:MAG: hypothetical protein M2R45_05007 [Verrucomicrobia subdivision 3 bacterium]|nr:hypothetical protein [Limisphaerales bacterium]
MSSIRAPANLIAVGDGCGFEVDRIRVRASFPEDSPMMLVPSGPRGSGEEWVPISARHDRRANMLFADGHVEADTLYNWSVPLPEKRRRWNWDNQPHPEDWRKDDPDNWNPRSPCAFP